MPIAQRLAQLIEHLADLQYTDEDAYPARDRSIEPGQYPTYLEFTWRNLHHTIEDASGSSIMAIWFLSQTHKILDQIKSFDTTAHKKGIMKQLENAAKLPAFFQGDGEDKMFTDTPEGGMGWWPLLDGYRMPAFMPNIVEQVFLLKLNLFNLRQTFNNMADGDYWSWCMSAENTTPGVLQTRFGLREQHFYADLLGSKQTFDDIQDQMLIRKVRVRSSDNALPIGTYYSPRPDLQFKQRVSVVVNANILSGIPLMDDYAAHLKDIEAAREFVCIATQMAMDNDISMTWEEHSYDYFIIDTAPIAYIARAHKRIVEIKSESKGTRDDFPDLLDQGTLQKIVAYTAQRTEQLLADPSVCDGTNVAGYTKLIFTFHAMMNLHFVNRGLFADDLVERAAKVLLERHVPEADRIPGTGPFYTDFGLQYTIASPAFISPALLEAFALYQLNKEPTPK